ncbi:MAG: hypothetical protein WC360_02180, partial [Opitutales bacterium]
MMQGWKRRVVLTALLIAAVLIAACFIVVGRKAVQEAEARQQEAPVPVRQPEHAPAASGTSDEAARGPAPAEYAELLQAIEQARAALAEGRDAAGVLAELWARLEAASPDLSSAAIRAFLAGGQDADTGLDFAVGQGGTMLSVPTLRVFLLDLLARIDPQAALEQAQIVFDAKASADEYAVCLRNVGMIDRSAAGRAYVGRRARELLADPGLSAKPSAGFVEAFDAVVYSGDMEGLSALSAYAGPGLGVSVNVPSFMAMDRMVIDDTADAL